MKMEEDAKRIFEQSKKTEKKDGIFKRLMGGNKSSGATAKNVADEPAEARVGPPSLSPIISPKLGLSRGASPYNSKHSQMFKKTKEIFETCFSFVQAGLDLTVPASLVGFPATTVELIPTRRRKERYPNQSKS